jgi:putative spermidine/putrescine transport system permease protein
VSENRATRWVLGLVTVLILLFLFIPIAIIVIYAFNPGNVQGWPPDGLSLRWFSPTFHDEEARKAFVLSLEAGAVATGIALLLGSLAAFGVHRFRFFGRETISFLLVLPLALPGVLTGIALNSLFTFGDVTFSLATIVVGHATFCIVIVYNNVLARLRRTSPSMLEASMDLGASGFTAFRTITLPVVATALVAGALLAFALSFDEVIVTTFTAGAQNTLPLWIFGNIRLGQRLPEVNVAVLFVMVLTVVPVILAQRLTRDTGVLRQGRAGAGGAG